MRRPILVSSIPATLGEIRFIDAAGVTWQGKNLRTGERVTLQRASSDQPLYLSAAGAMISQLQFENRGRRGYFYAQSDRRAVY